MRRKKQLQQPKPEEVQDKRGINPLISGLVESKSLSHIFQALNSMK